MKLFLFQSFQRVSARPLYLIPARILEIPNGCLKVSLEDHFLSDDLEAELKNLLKVSQLF